MRALFINHCHPETPHVCALRMKSFAQAMADKGHQILLLTEALDNEEAEESHELISQSLINHNWSRPFILSVTPVFDRLITKLRQRKLIFGIRQLFIFLSYLNNSGVFSDWSKGAFKYEALLKDCFRPDIIWATFGNSDCWKIAQYMSCQMGIPWVADVKDNWEVFIPKGMSTIIANRFNDMAALTAFSLSHKDQVKHIFNRNAEVIYSGFSNIVVDGNYSVSVKRIMVTGSLYDFKKFEILVCGILLWIKKRTFGPKQIEFRYAGKDFEIFDKVSSSLKGYCTIIVDNYIEIEALRKLQAGAWINAYVFNEKSLFQHKTVELISAARPVLAVPLENQETLSIAKLAGVNFEIGRTPLEVAKVLESFEARKVSKINMQAMSAYSWEAQAKKLEKVLISIGGSF